MKKLLFGILGLVVLFCGGLLVSASIISKHRLAEFKAFDAWDAEGARQAKVLTETESEAYRCERLPVSRDSGRELLGVVDFSAALRSVEGVQLPFEDKPMVVYFGPGGLQARRATVDAIREHASDLWAVSWAILRRPSVLAELASPVPRLRIPSMTSDVNVALLARFVDEQNGRVHLVGEMAVTSRDSGELFCQGRVELELGTLEDSDHRRAKRLAEAVQQLVDSPRG